MGPLRRGLILSLLPLPAWAGEACDAIRTGWDGTPISAWTETFFLITSPISLVLLAATVVALKFRSKWGALIVCVLWSFFVSGLTLFDMTGGLRTAAMAEGCIGSPTVFIVIVAATCVALILHTAPRPEKE